jgi:hypothetical protein
MFESSVNETIIATSIGLWFAHSWYLNTRLREVHRKLDRTLQCFDGLRTYLYEIDPQFDDERRSNQAVFQEEGVCSAMDDMALLNRKKAEGRRTLNTPFHRIDDV